MEYDYGDPLMFTKYGDVLLFVNGMLTMKNLRKGPPGFIRRYLWSRVDIRGDITPEMVAWIQNNIKGLFTYGIYDITQGNWITRGYLLKGKTVEKTIFWFKDKHDAILFKLSCL